jgi:hypothetical protein
MYIEYDDPVNKKFQRGVLRPCYYCGVADRTDLFQVSDGGEMFWSICSLHANRNSGWKRAADHLFEDIQITGGVTK